MEQASNGRGIGGWRDLGHLVLRHGVGIRYLLQCIYVVVSEVHGARK